MKKEGFTLIEVVGALAIISIIFTVSFKGFKYYDSHVEKIKSISELCQVREILSFSKEYCYENESYGEVYFDNSEKLSKVYLVSQGMVIKTVYITEEIKLGNSNCIINNKRFLKISINKYGYISPYTIELIDKKGRREKIIIQVGGNLVYIKDEKIS